MATKKYLDETGLADVAGHVNSRLKTVSTMPVTADLNAVRLYTGEDTQTYKKGHIYQMAATEQNFLQFSADTTTYFMSEDGTITSTAPTSYTSQVEDVPFTDESTGATLVYMAGNNALVQKLENDVNVITVNFNKIKTSVMPWWTAGAATGSYNPFTIRNVQLVAVTAWVDITSGGGIKTVTVMPENPTDKDVVIYIGESGMVYEQNHIYQYDLAEDEWIDITAVVPDEEAREVAAGAMALAEEAFETSAKIWKGSLEDWEQLSLEEKAKYDYVASDDEDDPITAATLPYDNTESGLVSTNVQGAIDEVNKKVPTSIRKSPYVRLGLETGCPTGFLQSIAQEDLKCVLIIGNSLTGCPLTYTVGGESVTELREVGATHPNSGWTSLVRNYLVSLYPNVKVYKTNGAAWEQTGTLGNRSYNLIKDLTVWDVTENGAFETELTVSDVLPQADIVTIELFENVGDCVSTADTPALATDYNNLYSAMKAINPNAHYVQWFGFWYDELKRAAILRACAHGDSAGIADIWTNENYSLLSRAPTCYCGEAMQYGIDGSEIGNIPAAGATHPNDSYYYTMAVIWLFCMFNQTFKNGLNNYIPKMPSMSAPFGTYSVFNPPANAGLDYNTEFGESTDPIAVGYRVILPGNYICGAHYYYDALTQTKSTGYGYLKVTFSLGNYVQDFDAYWCGEVSKTCIGFTIRQTLFYLDSRYTNWERFWTPKLMKYQQATLGSSLGANLDLNNFRIYCPSISSNFKETLNTEQVYSFIPDNANLNIPFDKLNITNYCTFYTNINWGYDAGWQRIEDIQGRVVERYRYYNGWSTWESIRN